ncbi:ABC transporter ATP-binding protein [Elioraea sp.]|uniref:ABC transporter ATP-binding protein n=1 Tax=Elioraea sp. TaxID=2185103 RepID=UPI0021DD0B0A|nr:oligopeptide/dipeptide ABC transporter ATP-binding protein [Elioraea sp.]GIX11829.1 MAG: ABC transporter ATP-binding protein [Elioraea sp.]
MTALLEAEGLARHYAVRLGGLLGRRGVLRAVDGVSFRLDPGRTLALVGESGCGKTTTAKLVLGLVPPTRGTTRFEGEALPPAGTAAWRALRARMQMVYQDPLGALDRRLPVVVQVAEPLAIHGGLRPAERRERALAMLAQVGLPAPLAQRYPHELSGGQRQRVVLARALILGPRLIVADEPVSALDVSIQAQVLTLFEELQARFGVAFLFISHDLKVVRQVAHEVAVMYLGRIVEQGTPEALFGDPAHPYTRALVSAIPVVRRNRARARIVLDGDPPNPIAVPPGCAFHPRCPVALAACRGEAPALKPRGDGRLVACHLAHGEAAARRPAA